MKEVNKIFIILTVSVYKTVQDEKYLLVFWSNEKEQHDTYAVSQCHCLAD